MTYRLTYRKVDIVGEWAAQGLCVQLPVEAKRDFFPPTAEDNIPTGKASRAARDARFARAVKVCATCPVQDDCRRWAYKNRLDADHDGVLGGETPQQRRNNRVRNRTVRNEHAA